MTAVTDGQGNPCALELTLDANVGLWWRLKLCWAILTGNKITIQNKRRS